MKRGRFIVFEGGEGAGKSTQARYLSDDLQARGLEVVLTREPGGTPGAEAIRQLLLDPDGDGWGPQAEALLFAAARADHVARLIRPALERGAWVICDRFVDSSRAYQGVGGGLPDAAVLALHAIGSGGLLPDLTILLEGKREIVADRIARRDGGESDRIGGRDTAFHDRVNEAFRRFAADEPQRFRAIDSSGSREETRQRVLDAVAPLLSER